MKEIWEVRIPLIFFLVAIVELVYDTSSGTTTRVIRRGSLIRVTKALDVQAG
jgi:hypothetical protein